MRGALALVTGGSSGIGFAMARELGRRGYQVALVARDLARLQAAADGVRSVGAASATVLSLDLTRNGAAEALAGFVAQLRQPVSVLVNSAGGFLSGSLAELSEARLGGLLALNAVALHTSVRAVLPGMREARHGRILNVGSLAGLSPAPGLAAYGASKAFVHSYSIALREELRGSGVTVSTLAPGLVDTDLVVREGASALVRWAYRLSSSPETVALVGYRGMMAGEALIVPGLSARALWYGMRLVPATARARILRRIMMPFEAATGRTA